MTFKIGDKVRANGREAEIVGYDEGSDRMAWRVAERGGSLNTYHGHISTTRLEPLEAEDESADDLLAALATIDSSEEAVTLSVVPDTGETVETELSADELLPPVDSEDSGASE